MTIHKSQGSTIEFMIGDMNRSCKTPNYKSVIDPGMFYTMLSRLPGSDRLKLDNFEGVVKSNEKANMEMYRLRTTSVLPCTHPIEESSGNKVFFMIYIIQIHERKGVRAFPRASCAQT